MTTTPAPIGNQAGNRTAAIARVVAWVGLGTIIVLTLVPPALRPVSAAPNVVEHFAAFLLAGAAFALGYPQYRFSLFAASIACIAVLELLQLFVPGRHARVSDFVVNAIGACIGIALVRLVARTSQRSSTDPLG
jgi:VanZ family protein